MHTLQEARKNNNMKFRIRYTANSQQHREFKVDLAEIVTDLAGGSIDKTYNYGNEDLSIDISCAGERVSVMLGAKTPVTIEKSVFDHEYEYDETCRIFINGYQSWTETREYTTKEKVHNLNRLPRSLKEKYHFEAYGDPWFYRYQDDLWHGYTYTYVENDKKECDFIGSLNEENAFLIVNHEPWKKVIHLESDAAGKVVDDSFKLFDFVNYHGPVKDCLRKYFGNYGKCTAPKIKGYTSWYKDYQNINEAKMLDALEGIDKEHYDLFQIDDGYETFVGDWLDIDKTKFPNGLKGIVDKVHTKGLKAGIWLAPFVAETKSRLYREHPEWVLHRNGREVFAGSNWSGDVALDVRKREVQDYIRETLSFYAEQGFDFFKLDFLYAAAMCAGDTVDGENDGDGQFTRAEIMRLAMKGIRDILSDKLILGCGVPLSSAFNLVDYCRIGPDVSLKFDDAVYMRFMHRERVSTKTTIQNTIFRSGFDGTVFRCDPDVYLLRDNAISLNKKQREALIMINHLCGSVYMTSDNVKEYDDEKKALLAKAEKLIDAEIVSVSKKGRYVSIVYKLDGEEKELTYDTRKGVLING